ncbi:MAG: hypothetical protein Terrestrivirus1_237 [Terrestrivirus sp.]|jgi:endonuclease I|uniref:Endonuclease I n=1 Tax=Terrestrivirus sp. TaxID=2487775 RepID=A0A3G4ZP47_9VIRU|nr:MAG: hypothetical protein Terrestrivirus1_237 [Terrestrivirus sp.]
MYIYVIMENYEKERKQLLEETKNISGVDLRNYLKDKFYIKNNIPYNDVGVVLFKVDDGKFYDNINSTPKAENCEHVVPQSLFSEKLPMRSDLHHLYLCGVQSNSLRSNYKFEDIPLSDKPKWIINDTDYKATIVPSNPDEYSDYITNKGFEPKKVTRGNVARACAYFFTMYPEYFDVMPKVIDVPVMIEWNEIDPVNDYDITRNYAIYDVQKNLNPYVLAPELISKAFE